MKKIYPYILSLVVLISLIGCEANKTDVSSGTSATSEAVSSYTAPDNATESLISDEELVNRVLYLFDSYTHPTFWYTGAGTSSLDVYEANHVEPLPDTPEGTTFYPVLRFYSIAEMKRATEQVMTKEFSEKNLYPYLEELKQFLERDGRLYINTSAGSGVWPFRPDSAAVISKSEDTALLSVLFIGPYDEKSIREVEMKYENQTWKLNSSPYIPNEYKKKT